MQNANNGDLRSVVQLGYPCLDRTTDQHLFRCASISWIYVGDSVSDLVINVFEI